MRLDEIITEEMCMGEAGTFQERIFKRLGDHITREIRKSIATCEFESEATMLIKLHERILLGSENGNPSTEEA